MNHVNSKFTGLFVNVENQQNHGGIGILKKLYYQKHPTKLDLSDKEKVVTNRDLHVLSVKYSGELVNNQRNGRGKETWSCDWCSDCQKYEGEFFQNSLHGIGSYIWNINNEKTIYEGLIYASMLEGYGRISNNDNTKFEGLFKENLRFGPGVFTYSDGCEDVGFWYGKNLLRLCVVVKPEWVPRLAVSSRAKIQLLKYKKLVKICSEVVDPAKDLLRELQADEEVVQQSEKLYSRFVRHRKSLFFNTPAYDENFFSTKDCYIDIVVDEEELESQSQSQSIFDNEEAFDVKTSSYLGDTLSETRIKKLRAQPVCINKCTTALQNAQLQSKKDEALLNVSANDGWGEKPLDPIENAWEAKISHSLETLTYQRNSNITNIKPTKRVLVTHLLAWNNEFLSVDFMRHAFLHRNFEKFVSFPVMDVLCGNRKGFKMPGSHEKACKKFLSVCSNGNYKHATELLSKNDLNPDLCDSKGNTGIIYASARDRHKTIKTLVDFGANVDVFNDESLTPLCMCILRYLATQHDVKNWEKAFLRSNSENVEESNRQKWCVCSSSSSSFEKIPSYCATKLEAHLAMKDLQEEYPMIGDVEQSFLLNLDCIKPEPVDKRNHRRGTLETKMTVLNKVASTLDEELLQDKLQLIYETILILLNYGADPNICEVPMPTLLLALFTKNLELIKRLLEKGANPNCVTVDDGLTALHILASLPPCEEHFEELKLLLQHSADPNIKTSVSHWFAEKQRLLGSQQSLVEDDGKTPLQLLAMRYDYSSDVHDNLEKMASALMEYGANASDYYLGHTPLSLAVLRGNAKLVRVLLESGKVNPNQILEEDMGVAMTVWILRRYTSIPTLLQCEEILKTLLSYGANPLNSTGQYGNVIEFMNKQDGEYTSKKRSKLKKTIVQDQVKMLLVTATEESLRKHIKGQAVKILYRFVEIQNYYDDLAENMAKLLTPPETIRILQLLFHEGELPIHSSNYDTVYDLVEFIINVNYPSKAGNRPTSFDVDIDQLLYNFQFEKLPPKIGFLKLPQPEVEKHHAKYDVCFHCCRRLGCLLFKCPKCQLVSFCSALCNSLSNKQKGLHRCNIDFYNKSKMIYDQQFAGIEWELSPVERFVDPDPKRQLHLTRMRNSIKNSSASALTMSKADSKYKRKRLRDTHKYKFEKTKKNDAGRKSKQGQGAGEKETLKPNEDYKEKRRLPKELDKYLGKMARLWLDYDLSVLFLPYVCYRDGQLYYRFDKVDPTFVETYSLI
ncbi:hypothetical protein FQA39_LY10190 [Lamprigera yunnana]|nr:hypothetical protein FQA39_LY10190 [Lamprigera yunnana]